MKVRSKKNSRTRQVQLYFRIITEYEAFSSNSSKSYSSFLLCTALSGNDKEKCAAVRGYELLHLNELIAFKIPTHYYIKLRV